MGEIDQKMKKQRRNKVTRRTIESKQLERFDSLPWNPSLPAGDCEDPFSLFSGTNELDGGFLSLEEIDESDYVLDIPESVREDKKEKAAVNNKSKKRKTVENDDISSSKTESKDDIDEEKKKVKPKKKRNKRKKKTKKGEKTSEETEDPATGLLSLEEINESDYVLDIPESVREDKKEKAEVNNKSKKRKTVENDGIFSNETESKDDIDEEKKKVKPKKKRNKRKKKTKKGEKTSEETEDPATDIIVPEDDIEGESIDEAEYYAWNELRLHSLLMKSIHRLKFKEPTPIQKACIPAAAHQGKDVIGAAETGSGKTLAFGLPMLQRLLEEKEKADNIVEENGEAAERIAPKGVLRGLIITPTRELALQVNAHLKAVALGTNIKVVPIVGGMSSEKQERLLKSRPEIVVGTPGRLWELMSSGQIHLVELHSLSFFVLDEADRMIETGHFQELQSIIDMLPMTQDSHEGNSQKDSESCVTVSSFQRKKRQTLVFSATLSLSDDFRKKLKRGALKSKQISKDGLNLETLSERAGMKANAAIIDLTNALIMADKLEESFIECGEVNKDAHLYYILSVHGQGRTIVFCTSIAALRHISSLLRIVGINVYTLHGEMEQNARLKSMDRFRENDHGILVATDVAARGLDIPGVRTVIHYQLPHSAEVYVHRSGRTARASTEGCSIILLSPKDRSKFASLCKSFSKESFRRFPVEISYMPEVSKRLSLARQIDKISRKESQNKAKETWLAKNAEAIEVDMETDESEDERVESHKQKKSLFMQLQKLQHELNMLLSRPLQPKTFSRRYLAGAGVSPFLQHQFEELATQKLGQVGNPGQGKRGKFLVIGQDCVEPLQALKNANREVMNLKEASGKWKNVEDLRRKKKEQKKRLHDQRRKLKKQMKNGME